MTSDYVDAVLFRDAWEAVEDRDAYFMGISDLMEPSYGRCLMTEN